MSNPPSSKEKKKEEKPTICPSCGSQVVEDVKECPHCGFSLVGTEHPSLSVEFPEVTESTFSFQDGAPIDLKQVIEDMYPKVKILWEERKTGRQPVPQELLFPNRLAKIVPKEVLQILDDVQKCYQHNIANACPGLLRKALTSAIKIKFYMEKKRASLYDEKGNRKGDC